MNILQLSAVKSWGGGENHIENLSYELQRSFPEVNNIILTVTKSEFHKRLLETNYKVIDFPLRVNVDPRAIFTLIKTCKNYKIDLIHLHDPTALSLAVIANNFSKLPPFIFSKKTTFPIKDRKSTFYKYNHPNLKKILCVSKETKKIASKAIKDISKLEVIYHGTRIDNKSAETPFNLRNKLNIDKKTIIIGHIGNHIKAKDLGTWLSTIDYLVHKKERKNLCFVQIGSFSKLTPGVKKRIDQLKLKKYSYLVGALPNASNFIPQFDILLVSSKSEGMPQVIYEAFYHKTPIVATKVGGIPEVIEHQKNGMLSPPGDFKSLGDNILELLSKPELNNIFIKKSFDLLFPEYTAEQMAAKTVDVYRQVIQKNNK